MTESQEEMSDNYLTSHLTTELRRLRESYLDHILELYLLETNGNLIDFYGYRKRVTNNELIQYLRTTSLQNKVFADEEISELIALKSSQDSTSLKQSDFVTTDTVLSTTTPITTTAVTVVNASYNSTTVPAVSSQSSPLTKLPHSISTSVATTPKTSQTPTELTPLVVTSTTPLSTNKSVSPVGSRLQTRQHSISSFYDSSLGTQDQIVERAKHEAAVVQRVAELRKQGLWSSRRLPKVQEPMRKKTHWDYLLEEMQWLATDFSQERKWKKAAAKKCAKMVVKYHADKQCFAERAEREELMKVKKIASNIAKLVKSFWSDVEKVFEAKQEVRLNEKRKKLHDMHLNFIVDKADQYTERLTQELGKSMSISSTERDEEMVDNEFHPDISESDDEETIAKEEEEVGIGDSVSEIELLKKESEIPLEDLLPKGIAIVGSIDGNIDSTEHEDKEFEALDEEVEDEEDTIEEEEQKEGKVDYSAELKELDDDMNVPIQELISKYSSIDAKQELDSDDDEDDMECEDETEEDDNTEADEEYCNENTTDDEEAGEIGMEFLINPDANHSLSKPLIEEIIDDKSAKTSGAPNREITDIAAGAQSLQPKGNTFQTTKVCTKVPFLLKHELREYQHIGLDWLSAMYDKKLNGILADEMGLGKTIQTIALLAHLACDKSNWGPHLIVVPTSVMLNWEMEFKKWCPAFKILTYYGSPKERKHKRRGWTKPNQFHVCITSYKLVIQDHASFRRKKWKYLILDEAQHIKNFKSQRWQMLLNFNTSRRLLLTGTPLQNNLMELWSLMHFLMPNVFQSHKEFKDWFVNPVTGMVEGNNEYNEGLIRRLHKVLRPFLLRRLKCDVEKQLPKKYEHIVMCHLSKRQRFLYEEFMSLRKTKETLMSGNFLSVINILMQLRKVCNHPNLFDPRPTVSPFMSEPIVYKTSSLVTTALDYDPFRHINLSCLNLILSELSFTLSAFAHHRIVRFMTSPEFIQEIDSAPEPPPRCPRGKIRLQIRTSTMHSSNTIQKTPSNVSSLNQSSNKNNDQKYLMTGIHTQNSPVLKSPTATTSSSDGRVAIPVGRLVQTPTGPHILLRTSSGTSLSSTIPQSIVKQSPMRQIIVKAMSPNVGSNSSQESNTNLSKLNSTPFRKSSLVSKQLTERKEKLTFLSRINQRKCLATALYASDLIEVSTVSYNPKLVTKYVPIGSSVFNIGNGYLNLKLAPFADHYRNNLWHFTDCLIDLIKTPEALVEDLKEVLTRFMCIVPRVMTSPIQLHASHLPSFKKIQMDNLGAKLSYELSNKLDVLHTPYSLMRIQFPELRLIQYDCGKLQTLNKLLWDLKTGGHRVLIFTQMSRMLDIFEQFLNHCGHTYLRLDGTTKVEQRQALMERFNADKRIFCFILSTRSGGIGINLTGADTVIFYDSDWNPTMDAQAQDRCHRIGQTRDVHIYRLISEKTIEENIVKKAQQKKLLGSVAIEGGNFTTAFFKQNAIHELFGIDLPSIEERVDNRTNTNNEDTSSAMLDFQLEQALGTAEEANDVAAAKTAGAEAEAEFAEFDENIPIDSEFKEEEKSPEEERIDEIIGQLTPVEKYAMKLLEVLQESVSFEQIKQAEEEIETHKKEWELRRIETVKEEQIKKQEAMEEDKEPLLTCYREDAYNQVFISYNGFEQMPIWAPPTPPQDENDLYIDYSLGFLYETTPMTEQQLPPIFVPKEPNKRLKLDSNIARKQKSGRKEEGFNIPRSLFDRPSTSIIKLRRELILQKLKGILVCGPENAAIHRTLNALNASCLLPQTANTPAGTQKAAQLYGGPLQDSIPKWAIHEDWTILQVIQHFQDLPLNLLIVSPGHVPNWDLVSDVINMSSCNYRSPKLCRYHYDVAIVPREEGKANNDLTPKPKQKKMKGLPTPVVPSGSVNSAISTTIPPLAASTTKSGAITPNRIIKTSQLISEDNNMSFTQLCSHRFETIKQIANKRTPTLKHMFVNPTAKNPKHIALLSESGINFDQPLTPIQVASNRAERISREKQKAVAEQQMAARQLQQQLHQKQQQQSNIKAILTPNNIQSAQQQFSQTISAKMSAINQTTISKGTAGPAMTANVNVSSQQLSQPILSQINVSSQNIVPTTVGTSGDGITQGMQPTCSVVSVASLPPQVQQKLIAAVSPATVGQMTGQNMATRLTTANPQIYKQIILRNQQQQQIPRQQTPHIQMQTIPQTSKQITNIGVTQQPSRFQITATVPQQSTQPTQSIIATPTVKTSQSNVITTLPVAVPVTGTQQRITTTTGTGKPVQQIITRTITDPIQMAQLFKRQVVGQQSSGNLNQTQILVQQSASHQTQSSQSQTQILQNPVTFVKTLSSPATLATQSLTIPITMTGMNIFTTPGTKVMSPTASSVTTSAITSIPTTQLRQIQLLQQKRSQQNPQVIQQQQIQSQLNQQIGQQTQQKLMTATISGQTKGTTSIQSSGAPVAQFQIVHQSSAGSQTNANTKQLPPGVTVQQLQQALHKGLVLPPHMSTIHVSQSGTSTTTGATLIPQSILQAVSQSKLSDSSQQNTSTSVSQITPNQQTVKHIQVVSSASSQTQSSGSVTPKSIIISGQPTILQTTSLQSQPQTVTFAIRAAQSTGTSQPTISSQTVTSVQTSDTNAVTTSNSNWMNTITKETEIKEEFDVNNPQSSSRQSPYGTRQRNTKS
ncbi:helicase domino-like isoform X2 [Oppia nitens]|uniref:helicase domino-like isoform X2 n=1 Tax=Oppia nitens TaxID=1686743 RepID=UPI0023DA0EF3|nr:helicase domino-like isoform X2 [Oppia nitens]